MAVESEDVERGSFAAALSRMRAASGAEGRELQRDAGNPDSDLRRASAAQIEAAEQRGKALLGLLLFVAF